MAIHEKLAAGRWRDLSLCEQMGNIGSEVGRAILWREKGDAVQEEKALTRALELFDLTISDARHIGRLKELARAREVVCDALYGDNKYQTSFDSLDRYFLQFALAARLHK